MPRPIASRQHVLGSLYIDGTLMYDATMSAMNRPDFNRIAVREFAGVEFYPSEASLPMQCSNRGLRYAVAVDQGSLIRAATSARRTESRTALFRRSASMRPTAPARSGISGAHFERHS